MQIAIYKWQFGTGLIALVRPRQPAKTSWTVQSLALALLAFMWIISAALGLDTCSRTRMWTTCVASVIRGAVDDQTISNNTLYPIFGLAEQIEGT